MTWSRVRWFCCGVLFLCACGHPNQPTAAPRSATSIRRVGPVTDLVPAAGLRWMLVARGHELSESPAIARAVLRLVSQEHLDAFARVNGIDLRALPLGCIAGFDFGELYLAQGVDRAAAERAFKNRLSVEPRARNLDPDLVWIDGLVGNTPEAFVGVGRDQVAIAVGDLSLARASVGFATGKLIRSPSALHGAALSAVSDPTAAPLLFYAPGPFQDKWEHGIAGLLANTTALRVAVTPGDANHVDVELTMMGQYSHDPDDTERRLISSWEAVSKSPLGRLLGLDSENTHAEPLADGQRARLLVKIATEPLATGLHDVVSGDLLEILQVSPLH